MPSYTEIIPSPGFMGSNNGSHKRKRNGNAEAFLSSHGQDPNTIYKTAFSSANLHRLPADHELQMNDSPADLQVDGNWVPGDDAIHKRRRCSDLVIGDQPLNQEKATYSTPNTNSATASFRGIPSSNTSNLFPRPHMPRTTSSPHPNYNYSEVIKEGFNQTTTQHMQLPCHICHKRPRYKDELDHFTFCQECGRRTCNICVRECFNGLVDESVLIGGGIDDDAGFDMEYSDNDARDGDHARSAYGVVGRADISSSNGRGQLGPSIANEGFGDGGRSRSVMGEGVTRRSRHRERICSMCCVEKGEEGEVFCLGCVEGEYM